MVAKKPSVLAIDDDIVLLKTLENILQDEYLLSLARSGMQAIVLLERGFVPDVILLDIDMPEKNGYETIQELQTIKAVQYTPVVFLTGKTEKNAEIQGLKLGASDFIIKPVVKEILMMRLAAHIANGKQRRELAEMRENKSGILIDENKFNALAEILTPTEGKVARLVAVGYTNQEISNELNYSYSYVKKVTATIFEKTGINKRHELRQFLT